jgi:hypothetical protein
MCMKIIVNVLKCMIFYIEVPCKEGLTVHKIFKDFQSSTSAAVIWIVNMILSLRWITVAIKFMNFLVKYTIETCNYEW